MSGHAARLAVGASARRAEELMAGRNALGKSLELLWEAMSLLEGITQGSWENEAEAEEWMARYEALKKNVAEAQGPVQ